MFSDVARRFGLESMRSPGVFCGAIILLLGVALALLAAMAFDAGASVIIHLAMGASFIVIAFSLSDFELPRWITVPASAASGVLGMIFVLQGVSDLMQSATVTELAYGALGQRLEKVLGYVFLAWCATLLLKGSRGRTKLLGIVVCAMVFCFEAYSRVLVYQGTAAASVLKLVYLPLFVWLVLESQKGHGS